MFLRLGTTPIIMIWPTTILGLATGVGTVGMAIMTLGLMAGAGAFGTPLGVLPLATLIGIGAGALPTTIGEAGMVATTLGFKIGTFIPCGIVLLLAT